MRNWLLAGTTLCVGLAVSSALADNSKLSPVTFKMFGGMADGAAASTGNALSKKFLHRTIAFQTSLAPGSVLVKTGERKLYYILSDGQAIEYSVGVGREGFTWSGTDRITDKAEWPEWRPPKEMVDREAAMGHRLPELMPGGPDNPLGARAIYIGDTQFRIHGTTQPWSIGYAVSSGCIRMMNEEVIDLYNRVQVGATIVVE